MSNHNDNVIDTLNDLIEASKDGEYGFRQSGEHAKGADLQQLFVRRADDCHQAVTELQAMVVQLGGEAEDSGTVGGATHRGWVAVKATLSRHTDLALLEEAEDGEDSALESYRKALDGDALTGEVRALVERQYEGVKRNHAQMRTLRDQARASVKSSTS